LLWSLRIRKANRRLRYIDFGLDGKQENDLGYIIYHDYWGRGFGTEAAQACLDYAFDELGLIRIAANMAFDNFQLHQSCRKDRNEKRKRNILIKETEIY